MRPEIKKLLLEEVLSIDEAALLIEKEPSGFRHKIRNGTLTGIKKGRAWLLDKQDVLKGLD